MSCRQQLEARKGLGLHSPFLNSILVGNSRLFFLLFVTFAIINGAGLVAFGPLLSNTMNSIADSNSSSSDVSQSSLYLVYCAIGLMVVAFCMAFFAGMTASTVAHHLRFILVENVMKLDAGFFDIDTPPGEVINTLTSQTKQVEVFLSSSLPQLLNGISKAVAAIIVCFIYSWNVTLVTISLLVAMAAVMIFVNVISKGYEKALNSKTQAVLNKAAGIFGNIRTVTSFHAWKQAYDLIEVGVHACILEKPYVITTAFGQGVIMTANLGMSTLGLWYSGLSIDQGKNSQFEVLSVISTISLLVEGMLYVIIALPSLRSFSSAMHEIGILIDASPKIQNVLLQVEGEKESKNVSDVDGNNGHGNLEFANVSFAYPVQRDIYVLDAVSFTVEPGRSIALVGASGSGKSTVVSLLFRFYDPLDGKIVINGINIASMPLHELRSGLALVSQEPILFAKSIRENIMYGSLHASEDDVISAAKAASVHEFIMSLPNGYDTQVGERGTQLSGGQKQRIAIARAVIRKPNIFVFDEATSALDTKSERLIQAAIDEITEGSTSLTIAHRLSTIKNKDKIIAMRGGKVIEEGNHSGLMKRRGYYYDLVESQGSALANSVEDSETDDSFVARNALEEPLQDTHCNLEQTGDLMYLSSKFSTMSSKVFGRLNINNVSQRQTTSRELHQDTFTRENRNDSSQKGVFTLKIVGTISSMCIGASLPISGYFTSRFFGLYYEDPVPMSELSKWAWGLAGIAFLMGIISCIQEYCWMQFKNMALTKLRLDTVIALLRQEMAWYDQEENNLGALMSMIGSHASQGSQAMKDSWYYGGIATGSLLSAFIIAFTQQWIITFIMMSALVLMFLVVGVVSWLMQASQQSKERLELTCDSSLAENVFQHKIVSSFNLQDARLEEFNSLQIASDKHIRYISLGGGAIQGLSLFIGLSVYALAFWYGNKLVDQGDTTFEQLTGAIFPIFLGLVGLTNAQLQLPAISQGNKYLQSAALLQERKPLIDNTSSEGRKMISCEYGIDFKKVRFAYPSRPAQNVLHCLNLHVEANTSMAVVGGSGSGKSTIISLLLRLYDSDRGSILIDGIDIKTMSLESLRKIIGLVGQEPVLFDGTILENIRYGSPLATDEACKLAARQCLAEEFILNMPDGYSTYIGSKGISLSGGQKQRLAIARAVVKNPYILLLDEATSALDASSEMEVQKTLDKVMQHKTTIVVAHRLHTVRNVDTVTVLDSGSIVEQGTFVSLEKKQDGVFASMLRIQK